MRVRTNGTKQAPTPATASSASSRRSTSRTKITTAIAIATHEARDIVNRHAMHIRIVPIQAAIFHFVSLTQ